MEALDYKRSAERYDLAFAVLVEHAGQFKRQLAVNVSEAGMLFISREPYVKGQNVRITFNLPWTDVELTVESEVRHVSWWQEQSSFRVGIEFHTFEEGEIHPPSRCLPS